MAVKAVIVAIEFDDIGEYDSALQIAKHHFNERNENFDYCIRRERGLEALVCKEMNQPFIAYAHEGPVILDTNIVPDQIDTQHTRILYRSRHRQDPELLGMSPLLSDTDAQRVFRWPEHIRDRDQFLARPVSMTTATEMAERLAAGAVELPCFIKTLDKGPRPGLSLHHIFQTPEDLKAFSSPQVADHVIKQGHSNAPLFFLFQQPDWYCPYRDSMEKGRAELVPIYQDLIISGVMSIQRDDRSDNGKIEYRCYAGPSGLISISRYVDFDPIEVPAAARNFAVNFIRSHKEVLPAYYVVDIALTDDGYRVVELNGFEHSGRYLGNDPEALYSDINHHFPDTTKLRLKASRSVPGTKRSRILTLDGLAFAED